jgi:hypothetical protein
LSAQSLSYSPTEGIIETAGKSITVIGNQYKYGAESSTTTPEISTQLYLFGQYSYLVEYWTPVGGVKQLMSIEKYDRNGNRVAQRYYVVQLNLMTSK